MAIIARNTNQKPAYQQTELGMIPADWSVKKLGEIAPLQRGFDLPTSHLQLGIYPVVYSNGILNHHASFKVKAPGVVTGRSGTIGKVNYIENDYWPHNTSLWVTDFKGNLPKFIYYLYTYIKLERLGIGSGVPTLNRNDVHSYQLLLPPIPEQQAIATALSDIDTLITSLDKLIVKKRDIKQATMQQLLIGKMRLPGFSEQWGSRSLPEVCWFQEGPGVRNTQFTQSGIKLLNGTNIYRGEVNLESTDRFISEKEAFGPYAHFLVDQGDILIACSGITIDKFHEKVAFAKEEHLPLCMNTSTMRFKPLKGYLLADFLYQLLMSDVFKKQIGLQATGSAQLNFGPSHVAHVVFALPELKEQQAIATVLSYMDAEIVALEQRRDKTHALKQGMMQELLTGKTRLR